MSRVPFQLLELSLISAQDLAPGPKNFSKTLKTYAVTWINPDRKLRTGTDRNGNNNPNWNQKFIFRVDNDLMDSDSASVMVEIYAAGWIKPTLIASVSVLIRDLIPPSARRDRRVVALQVRRHSGRPQGILSMGVALLDNTMKSMPLCTAFTGSTVGFNEFHDGEKKAARLTRSLSDQTSLLRKPGEGKKKKGGSMCNVPTTAAAGASVRGGYGCNKEAECSVLGGSIDSDIGPSPSVVAFAVAHGLYPLQQGPPPPQNPGSSVLREWTLQGEANVVDNNVHPGYQRLASNKKRQTKRHRRHSAGDGDSDGRFSCFGNACGCEFNVVFGGKKGEKSCENL